ncbi:MAG: hypothetical protein HY741_13935 [Chloroflexi bacterium]|nr:hypothetical protein [Chloroflexota bacterium]
MTEQQLGEFNLVWFLTAAVIHTIMSVGLGLVFALLLPTLPGPPQFWAIVIGPLLWLGATSVVLPVINPAMSARLDWASFMAANIVYCLVMGFWIACTPQVPERRAYHLVFYAPTFLKKPTVPEKT